MSRTDTSEYDVTCSHCGKDTSFQIKDVDQLEDDIETDEDDARAGERRVVEAEFAGYIDPVDAEWRHLFNIGTAARSKDLDEVIHLIRIMAGALGGNLLEEFERGLVSSVPLFERTAA